VQGALFLPYGSSREICFDSQPSPSCSYSSHLPMPLKQHIHTSCCIHLPSHQQPKELLNQESTVLTSLPTAQHRHPRRKLRRRQHSPLPPPPRPPPPQCLPHKSHLQSNPHQPLHTHILQSRRAPRPNRVLQGRTPCPLHLPPRSLRLLPNLNLHIHPRLRCCPRRKSPNHNREKRERRERTLRLSDHRHRHEEQ
jgi:hypothetical protein